MSLEDRRRRQVWDGSSSVCFLASQQLRILYYRGHLMGDESGCLLSYLSPITSRIVRASLAWKPASGVVSAIDAANQSCWRAQFSKYCRSRHYCLLVPPGTLS
ncbi:hypothetical protein VFPFJ_02706 [Purpureocillium lilacinum]|uniref:Uncharacterized protein n=1 Tax=Purpureocillium lilacinum TaxID=33203 RepID=A0A179HU26_PURLI|nr:hypothetical protein VFPFJ_02706 [Purpureocillium lilacinum]OAQ93544.1 hypothetical protein VFPFJ_02706 [Purpureocillium lilacinum]